jgi:uncharacterized protein YprB with RNaseH-like and TPR domain
MSADADRFSRISALRPNAQSVRRTSDAGRASNWGRLVQLLGGEIRSNALGSYIYVQRRLPHRQAEAIDTLGLRLIVSDAADSVSDTDQWVFLDTETTGLAGGTGTYAFLVGLGWWEKSDFVIEQYFMRDYSEEPSLLLGVLECLNKRRVLVTYNGKSFDWPLLQTRLQMTRTGMVPELLAHLDLLHPARRIWRLLLKSVALEQLERHVLKLDRGRDIPSATIPQRYFDFLRGGSADAVAAIFYHNQWDLLGLATLIVHMTNILGNPEQSDCCAAELFGLSRLMQQRGKNHLAGLIYQKALDGGLPKAEEQIAQRELALMAKRERNFELSNALWEKLLDDSTEGLKAYRQLAIYYEHHAFQIQRAAMLTREALAKLQQAFQAGRISSQKYRHWHSSFHYRLARLEKKLVGSRQ